MNREQPLDLSVPSKEFEEKVLRAGFKTFKEFKDACKETRIKLWSLREKKKKLEAEEEEIRKRCPHHKFKEWCVANGFCRVCGEPLKI